jgi:oxygen-independent coproporphyrinogen III oxidase
MSEIATESSGQEHVQLGMYVHVPFCAKTCDFCAFYQIKPNADAVEKYLEGVAREAELVQWDRAISTVFWGGGTPGLLAPKELARLGELVRRRLGSEVSEWSVELAPSSLTEERLRVLKDLGVTRVSLGVQSFQPELLDALGRQHTREKVFRAYERIRQVGFSSVNLDLIFAIPGQDDAAWMTDVAQAVELAPDHLSTYCLTFEEDTALWVKLAKGKVKLDPEREAALYERTWEQLEKCGYRQYEISNFARPGHVCKHNLNTWRMNEWVGLGPSAASQHRGWRGTNIADLEGWRERIERGQRATEDAAQLSNGVLVEDSLIFGLRMNEGVNVNQLKAKYGEAPWAQVDALLGRLVDEGLAERKNGMLSLTVRGRLIADAIGGEIMGAFSTAEAA